MIQNLQQQEETLGKKIEQILIAVNCDKQYLEDLKLNGRLGLTSLSFRNCGVTDDQFNFILKALPNLESLNLRGSYKYSNVNFDLCPKLKCIDARGAKIHQPSLETVCRLPDLQQLQLMCDLLQEIKLAGCNKLKKLTLGSINITDKTWTQIGESLPSLQTLVISSGDKTEHLVIDNYKNLKHLTVKFTSSPNFHLKSCPLLQQLNFDSCCYSKNVIIQDIKLKKLDFYYLQRLDSLELKSVEGLQTLRVQSKCLQQVKIQNCNEIIDVNLTYAPLNDQKIKQLCQSLPKLQKLNLYSCENVSHLQLNCQHLKQICLRYTQIDDSHLQQLCYLPSMETVIAGNCSFKQIKLKGSKTLKELDFAYSTLADITLHDLPSLEKLVLLCANLENIQLQKCDKLKYICLIHTLINNSNVKQILNTCPQLQYISLDGCKNLSKFSLQNNNKIQTINLQKSHVTTISLKNVASLNDLRIHNCQHVKEVLIENCNQIKELNLLRTSAVQIRLNSLTALEKLSFRKCPALKSISLQNLPNIKVIDLDESCVSDIQVKQILNSLPNLQKLKLQNCQHLKEIKLQNNSTLKYLYLNNSSVVQCQLTSFIQLQWIQLKQCNSLKNIKVDNCDKLQYLNMINTRTDEAQLKLITQRNPNLTIKLYESPSNSSDSD